MKGGQRGEERANFRQLVRPKSSVSHCRGEGRRLLSRLLNLNIAPSSMTPFPPPQKKDLVAFKSISSAY